MSRCLFLSLGSMTLKVAHKRGCKHRPHPERLSLLSSGEGPWLSVSQDGVEDDEELADAGGEGLFGGFSGGSQLLVIGGDDGIGAGSDQCGHVKRGPHWGAPAGDGFSAAPNAAVAIDGGDADEGGDFSPIEAPELRQFGDQG